MSVTNQSQSLVTIGVALYNHEDYILQCLESLIHQSYAAIELIVVDDGSPDGSYKVAKNYLNEQAEAGNKIAQASICYTRPNQGMCHTLNEIAKQAKGDYISFIGSDDYWPEQRVAKQVVYLDSHPEYALVHANSIKVNAKSEPIGELNFSTKKNTGDIYEAIIDGSDGVNTPAFLYRVAVYEEIGYYDPQFRFEDLDFWLRLTAKFQVGFIDESLSYYRWHENNLSQSANMLKFYNDEIISIYEKNVTNPVLRKQALLRMYRKSYLRALRSFKWGHYMKNKRKYKQLLNS